MQIEGKLKGQTNGAKALVSLDFAIYFAVCWIVLALLSSPLFGVNWFAPGDFSYSGAMFYHAIMVPVLILFFLLAIKLLPLGRISERAYAAGAISSILFVGLGSIFNSSKGISVAAAAQIIGMVMTDFLGIILVAAMVIFALEENRKSGKAGMAFWLLFASVMAILAAAPLGHLAGWCIDIGIKSIPGSNTLLNALNIKPEAFQDGLVASHSHLIVAALLCGLAALTAIYFQYRSHVAWRKWISNLGLWMIFISLLLAASIYVLSALAGWEPPVLFASGANGIPLDDVVLTALEIGFLVLMAGISGSLKSAHTKRFPFTKANLRISLFFNWIFGFLGVVIPGIYIELNEGFYGAGEAPAPGALNDNIFIRAHMLYPFLLLPIIFAVTLAVGCKYNLPKALPLWPRLFVWISVIGMSLGLAGEILWFTTGENLIFISAAFVITIALIAGMISLWPGTNVKENYQKVQ